MTVATQTSRSISELRDLYAELHRFGIELRETSIRFQELVRAGGFAERGRGYSYSLEDPKDRLNRSIDITRRFEFLVAVTGAFSSGKSTLLNLLLGRPDLLPASVIPMTAVCTIIRYGDRPRARVRYVSFEESFERVRQCIGTTFQKPFTGPEQLAEAHEHPEHFVDDPVACESLRRFCEILRRYDEIHDLPVAFEVRAPYISGGAVLPAGDGYRYYSPTPTEEKEYREAGGDPRRWVTREWLALIQDVSLWVPSPLLENNIVFLDLPGLNCREDYHRRAVREYCDLADCILVAAFQPGNQADAEVIANFKKLSSNYHEKIFFAFNKVDQFAQEPAELVRAVDYLARDTIGEDFPRDRFFLTSGHLARGFRSADPSWQPDLDRLADGLSRVSDSLPGLDEWVVRVVDPEDPGGVGHLKRRLYAFLLDDAYRTKVAEIVRNYRVVTAELQEAASPTLEQSLSLDPADVLRRSVLDYFRLVEQLHLKAIRGFRYEYLRGHEDGSGSSLRHDLDQILESTHRHSEASIRAYFDRPLLTMPLLEDPVAEFDLQTVADQASLQLGRELRDALIRAVHEHVCEVFDGYFRQCDSREHLHNLFRGAPESARQVEAVLSGFQDTLLHSLKCIVRNGFYHLPRGRDLRRLERRVPLVHVKTMLVEVFTDFYPAWIYENIHSELIERLWLSIFLDCEDLEDELTELFRSVEAIVSGGQVTSEVEIPPNLMDGSRDRYRSIRMCQDIQELVHRREAIDDRARAIGVTP